MRMYEIITKKRHGHELTDEEIGFFVSGVVSGEIPDYQLSALLMAVCCNGMTDRETSVLTALMAESGEMVDLSSFGDLTADKHSTGGVGDKTTLVVAPVAAALGCKVAKMSGRGLGHTGGTIDKLESIPGFDTDLTPKKLWDQVQKIGIGVTSACSTLVPADKKLYALRDVTATVDSVPLIVSSIMSKKLAGGSKNIVLDVKTGSGAFAKEHSMALELAQKMVSIGKSNGRNVCAVVTNMDVPLGRTVGNALEVKEAVSLLRGGETDTPLYTVCHRLASELVALTLGIEIEKSESMVTECISSGSAYKKFCEWISAQGGDVSVLESDSFGVAAYSETVVSPREGFLTKIDTEGVGIAAMILGAGRAAKEDAIDPSAGIVIQKTYGDFVLAGEPIATVFGEKKELFEPSIKKYLSSVTIEPIPPRREPSVLDIIR